MEDKLLTNTDECKKDVKTLQKTQKKPNIKVVCYKTCYENIFYDDIEPVFVLDVKETQVGDCLLYDELKCCCGEKRFKNVKCDCCVLKFANEVKYFDLQLLCCENRLKVRKVEKNPNQEVRVFTLDRLKFNQTFVNISNQYRYEVKLIE